MLLIAGLGAYAGAQQSAITVPVAQTADSPAFEVAVLRRAGAAGGVSPYGSGIWSVNSLNLSALLPYAFDLRLSVQPVVGLPDWARSEYFSLSAKAEDGVILNRNTLRPRLRRFIEERFKLVTHTETKNVKGYALVVAKGGPKLRNSTKEDLNTLTAVQSGSLRNYSVTMDSFAGALQALLRRELGAGAPVVNETGLTGYYDVTLSFAPLVDVGRWPRESQLISPIAFHGA
jgi:uncharacterized protein (TIGR03435 family)